MYERRMKARNGHTYHIGIVARISGCQRQKELSLEDQVDHAKEEVKYLIEPGFAVVYHIIATKGKGERLDRPELQEVDALLRSRVLDLLIAEDLGRLVRGTMASELCGIAVDAGVRVVAPNDCIDTWDSSWEEDVIAACRDHVGHNVHTSKRLKQKMKNRFVKMGASTARPIYGYIVPPDSKTYDEWKKDPNATLIYLELFRRYKEMPNYSLLADWLNENNVPTGPYDRMNRWTSSKVRRVMSNTLLKGMPSRGNRHTIKHHETGRRVSVKNPAGPVYYPCPHLAHVPEDLWDAVNDLRQIRNRGLGRKPVNGQDPRAGVVRKRTIFPGQHARCGICGRYFYWGGHGNKTGMMCCGVGEYLCWNAMSFDGNLARSRIVQAILVKLEELPEFESALIVKLEEEAELLRSQSTAKYTVLEQEVNHLTQSIAHLADAISRSGMDDILSAKLQELRLQRYKKQEQLHVIKGLPQEPITLPPMATLRQRVQAAMEALSAESPEFGQLMNQVVTELKIFPYRICDGNRIVMRAKFKLNLISFAGMANAPPEIEQVLVHDLTVDLFEPPQRVVYREKLMSLLHSELSLREAARAIGISQVVAQKVVRLQHHMNEKRIDDPFESMQEPPKDDTKMKRHLHPRYQFRPLDELDQIV